MNQALGDVFGFPRQRGQRVEQLPRVLPPGICNRGLWPKLGMAGCNHIHRIGHRTIAAGIAFDRLIDFLGGLPCGGIECWLHAEAGNNIGIPVPFRCFCRCCCQPFRNSGCSS